MPIHTSYLSHNAFRKPLTNEDYELLHTPVHLRSAVDDELRRGFTRFLWRVIWESNEQYPQNVPISAWKAALSQLHGTTSTKLAIAFHEVGYDKFQRLHIDSSGIQEENVIARGIIYVVKELGSNYFWIMAEESLDDILRRWLRDVQNDIWSVLQNLVEHVVLYQLR